MDITKDLTADNQSHTPTAINVSWKCQQQEPKNNATITTSSKLNLSEFLVEHTKNLSSLHDVV